MKRKILFGSFFIVCFLALSAVVMVLWNILLPSIVNLPAINYLQALGLMLLCRILFGGFHFGGKWESGGENGSRFLKSKLMGMDEDSRKAFKDEWKKRKKYYGNQDD